VAERPLLGRPPMRKWRKSTPADTDPAPSAAPTPAPS